MHSAQPNESDSLSICIIYDSQDVIQVTNNLDTLSVCYGFDPCE